MEYESIEVSFGIDIGSTSVQSFQVILHDMPCLLDIKFKHIACVTDIPSIGTQAYFHPNYHYAFAMKKERVMLKLRTGF